MGPLKSQQYAFEPPKRTFLNSNSTANFQMRPGHYFLPRLYGLSYRFHFVIVYW